MALRLCLTSSLAALATLGLQGKVEKGMVSESVRLRGVCVCV